MSELPHTPGPALPATEPDAVLAAGDVHQIDVTVPLRSEFAATVRTMAASLGADGGFSIDEIDDLRLGLSEVFAAFVDSTGGRGRVTTSFAVGRGRISATVCPERAAADIELDDLASSILRSVADDVLIGPDGVTLVKQAVELARDRGPGTETA